MNRVPSMLFLLAALFWGWRTDHWGLGAVLGGILAGCSLLKTRWELSEKSYSRIWDLCCLLLLVGLMIYGASGSRREVEHGYLLVQWLPFLFLPMILAQMLGDQDKISYRVFSWLMRRQSSPEKAGGLNIQYLYLLIILLAASAANRRDALFYPALVLLSGMVLWRARSRRFAWPIWLALLLGTGVMGYGAHKGLSRLQNYLEGQMGLLFGHLFQSSFDPMESRTSLGQIGRLKLSGRIVYRLELEQGAPPELVRQASYNQFAGTTWSAGFREFIPIASSTNDSWQLRPDANPRSSFRVTGHAPRGRAILPIGLGTVRIDDMPALTLETNYLGVVRVSDAAGYLNYRAAVQPNSGIDGPITSADFEVPIGDEMVLDAIVEELELRGKLPGEACQIIAGYFARHFEYSTYLHTGGGPSEPSASLLRDFLLKTRTGHCEYFATATVLLLRRANIPARYAVGYAIQESAGKNKYVLRERHAHAWALVYYNGSWHDLDTTPSSWLRLESQQAGLFEPLRDLWDRIKLEFLKWRWGKASYRHYLVWVLIPLVLGLSYRIVSSAKRINRMGRKKKGNQGAAPGMHQDSEFYHIEKALSEDGWPRPIGLPMKLWLSRIESLTPEERAELDILLELHYRLRFDPHGIKPHQRQVLRQGSERCLNWLVKKRAGQTAFSH